MDQYYDRYYIEYPCDKCHYPMRVHGVNILCICCVRQFHRTCTELSIDTFCRILGEDKLHLDYVCSICLDQSETLADKLFKRRRDDIMLYRLMSASTRSEVGKVVTRANIDEEFIKIPVHPRVLKEALEKEKPVVYTIKKKGTKAGTPLLEDSDGYSYTRVKICGSITTWRCRDRNRGVNYCGPTGPCYATVRQEGDSFTRGRVAHAHFNKFMMEESKEMREKFKERFSKEAFKDAAKKSPVLACDISLETSFKDVSNDLSFDSIGQNRNEKSKTVEFTKREEPVQHYVEDSDSSSEAETDDTNSLTEYETSDDDQMSPVYTSTPLEMETECTVADNRKELTDTATQTDIGIGNADATAVFVATTLPKQFKIEFKECAQESDETVDGTRESIPVEQADMSVDYTVIKNRESRILVSSDGYIYKKTSAKRNSKRTAQWRCEEKNKGFRCSAGVTQTVNTFARDTALHSHNSDQGVVIKTLMAYIEAKDKI